MSETKTMSSNPNKRRIEEIDGRIEVLSHEIQNLDNFVSKSQLECSLMAVKLKREKVKALTALAKSKALLADMEVLIAESDLLIDLERLNNCKKIKLDCDAGKSQPSDPQEKPKSTNKTVAVQTSKSSLDKKRKHSSSKSSKSVDISSDETIIIPLLETHQKSKTEKLVTQFSIDLIKKSSTPNHSDSEVSISSSMKAEFEKPYEAETAKSEKKTERKKSEKKSKGKSDKKNSSKNKNNSSQQTQSPNTSKPKTVAELKARSVEQINKSMPTTSSVTEVNTPRHQSTDRNPIPSTSTFVPVRHNMPQIVTQSHGIYLSRVPHTTVSQMGVQNPASQTNFMYYNESRNGVVQYHPFYRNNQ